MPVTDEPNVLEGLSFVTSDGGKGILCAHISQYMAKSQSEQKKSHSWRFGPQRSETFSRVADLRFISCYHQASVFQNVYWSSHDFICFGYAFLALSI